jgi:hypothetical protein
MLDLIIGLDCALTWIDHALGRVENCHYKKIL